MGSDMPLGGSSSAAIVHIPDANESVRYYRHSVAPEFFKTLGIHILQGRQFTHDDRVGTPPVVMISESMGRRFWAGQSPIGKTIRLGEATGPEVMIVGVVADVRYRDLTTPLATSEPDVYFPLAQRPSGTLQLAIRTDLPAESITASIRRELAALDPTIPLFGIQPLEQLLEMQTASGRFASTILTVFGAAALVLTAVGLYGVLAFLVSLRQREIGIRLALGATQQRVLQSIVGHGLRLVAIGVVAGSIGAWLLSEWIAAQLYGVGGHDPLVFVAVPIGLLSVATLASWMPARRAARIDPQLALRSE
jgi:predicted permease